MLSGVKPGLVVFIECFRYLHLKMFWCLMEKVLLVFGAECWCLMVNV